MPLDPLPQARSSGLPARTIRLPKRYQDELPPAPLIPIPDPEPIAEQTQESPTEKPELVRESPSTFRTAPDSYGVLREYLPGKPSITPDEFYSLTGVSDSPYLAMDPSDSPPNDSAFPSPLRTLYKAAVRGLPSLFPLPLPTSRCRSFSLPLSTALPELLSRSS
jgi:hypothetical protein